MWSRLSEDLSDGEDYGGVRVENPFRGGGHGGLGVGDGPGDVAGDVDRHLAESGFGET